MYKKIKILSLCLLFLSCGATDRITRKAASLIDGQWLLHTVDYETNKKGVLTINMFDDIPFSCLENSDWNFIANNNKGNYILNNESCKELPAQYFIWSIPKEMYGFNHSIMMKPVNKKNKSVMNDRGYRMQLHELKEGAMVWSYETLVKEEKLVLNLYFSKL